MFHRISEQGTRHYQGELQNCLPGRKKWEPEPSQGGLSLLWDSWARGTGTSCAQVPQSYGAVPLGGEFAVWGRDHIQGGNSLLFINVMAPEDSPRS